MARWIKITRLSLASALLAGCAISHKPPPAATYFKSLRQVSPNGSTSPIASRDFTAFQRLIGARTVPVHGGPKVEEVFAFEANVPDGQGDEGAYMAIIRTTTKSSNGAQLLYIEQVNHKPRMDRYFHRELSAAEFSEFSAFTHDHPLASLRPAKATLTTAPAEPHLGLTPADAVPTPAEEETPTPVMFRVTDAHTNGALTVEFPGPATDMHPQGDLVKLMSTLRDAGETAEPGDGNAQGAQTRFICTYVQTIPPTATLLYADPFRKVEKVWANGGDVRAVISQRSAPATQPTEQQDRWLALAANGWTKSSPPPENIATTEPADGESPPPENLPPPPSPGSAVIPQDLQANGTSTAPATQTATPATPPSPFSNPNILPTDEYWTAEPRGTFTAVSHYVPMNEYQSQQVEFWVPTFQFDDAHMCVDREHGLIYLISDGALFSLPIPAVAMPRR